MSMLDVVSMAVPNFDTDRLVSLIFVTSGFHRTVDEVCGIVMHKCTAPSEMPFVVLFGNTFPQTIRELEAIPDYMVDTTCSLEQAKQSADSWLYNQLGEEKPIFVSSGFYGWTDDICKALDWRVNCDAIDLRQLYSAYVDSNQLITAAVGEKTCKELFMSFKKPPQRFGLKSIENEVRAEHITIGINPVVRAYSTSANALLMLSKECGDD